jgi:hypothetical protein
MSQRILVVEASEPVPWAKPIDLLYHPDEPLPPAGVAAIGGPAHVSDRQQLRGQVRRFQCPQELESR